MNDRKAKHRSKTERSWRVLAVAVVALAMLLSLLPMTVEPASASLCPPGYVLGPDQEVVNPDGSITRTPGDCIPATLDLNKAEKLNLNDDATEETGIDLDLAEKLNEAAIAEEDGDSAENSTGDSSSTPEVIIGDVGEVDPVVKGDDEIGPGYVTIHKFACEGDQAYGMVLNELRSSCWEQGGVTFNMSNVSVTDEISGSSSVTDTSGLATFEIFMAWDVTITESVPAGYGEPVVYCGDVLGTQVPGVGLQQFQAPGASISYQLDGDHTLYCEWFNVPAVTVADAGTGVVSVAKRECPLGFDAYSADQYDLAYECSAPLGGIGFVLSDGSQAIGQGTTDGAGLTGFTNVPAIPVSLVEQIPDGYGEPVVYCESFTPANPSGSPFKATVLAGNQIFYLMEPDEELSCSWYNVPMAPEGDSVVAITKHVCPAGYDAAGADWYDLAYNCPDVMADVTFDLNLGGSNSTILVTDQSGTVVFDNVPAQLVVISEYVPVGYGNPAVYCESYTEATPSGVISKPQVSGGGQIYVEIQAAEELHCSWYNVPNDEDGSTVYVHKFACPEGYDAYSSDRYGWTLECQTVMPDVPFTIDVSGGYSASQATDQTGNAVFMSVPAGAATITETIPDGYGKRVVYCESYTEATPNGVVSMYPVSGSGQIELDVLAQEELHCFWFNVPYEEDGGSITVNKYTCWPGYDLDASGADPLTDCVDPTDGVTFELRQGGNLLDSAVTGAPVPGAVSWTGLSPGTYTVTEVIPDGIDYVFVLDCWGTAEGWIQSYPLLLGASLDIPLGAEEHIVCSWYNVPEAPDFGKVTVLKYACSTEVFMTADDCEIFEGGVAFELAGWNGSGWTIVADGVTNAEGKLSWDSLWPGTYQVFEVGDEWCFATSDNTHEEGFLNVVGGEETTVWVYNCGVEVVNKKPVKLPNTGAGQSEVNDQAAFTPVTPGGLSILQPSQWQGVTDSRLVESFSSSTAPRSIKIEAIGVDATIETLEIVDGKIQDPTTADQVAWYKDTARLGEGGNVVMAGHLNYWGDPEGVFYALADLIAGDEIEITAQDGTAYRFAVVAVEQVTEATANVDSIVSPGGGVALTLITCGGDWDASAGQYLHRTVVQAELISPSGASS